MNVIQRQILFNKSNLTEKDKQLLTAVEYFTKRKKEMEKYIEGEHRWFGVEDYTSYTYNVSGKHWYDTDEELIKAA